MTRILTIIGLLFVTPTWAGQMQPIETVLFDEISKEKTRMRKSF